MANLLMALMKRMITMSKDNPWNSITKPSIDYSVRKIRSSSSIPLFWGKDEIGRYLLLIELNGDHLAYYKANTTTVKGMKIDLRQSAEKTKQNLIVTLEQQVDADLFHGLCKTLTSSLQSVFTSDEALAVALVHIKRWRIFFSGQRKNVLSPEEVRGLLAELEFLRFLYRTGLTQRSAIEAWNGPNGSHQDFIYENNAVEIKSLSGQERSSIRISSEDQLETLCENLYLVTTMLIAQETEGALSLNDAVKRIYDELSGQQADELFTAKLAAAGYVELLEYDSPKFLIGNVQAYSVSGEFPKLTRSSLPEGVVRVGYEIKLENIADFKCKIEELV